MKKSIKEKNSIIEQLSDKLEKSLSEIKAMSSNVNNANGYIAINKKLKEEIMSKSNEISKLKDEIGDKKLILENEEKN